LYDPENSESKKETDFMLTKRNLVKRSIKKSKVFQTFFDKKTTDGNLFENCLRAIL
jgi:hypothetical protein